MFDEFISLPVVTVLSARQNAEPVSELLVRDIMTPPTPHPPPPCPVPAR